MEIFCFISILQACPRFIIEIKCSALNLKYLSQYLNGLGACAFGKIFKIWFLDLYSYWHINIIAPLLSDFKTFFCQNIQLNWPTFFFSSIFLKTRPQFIIHWYIYNYDFTTRMGWQKEKQTSQACSP